MLCLIWYTLWLIYLILTKNSNLKMQKASVTQKNLGYRTFLTTGSKVREPQWHESYDDIFASFWSIKYFRCSENLQPQSIHALAKKRQRIRDNERLGPPYLSISRCSFWKRIFQDPLSHTNRYTNRHKTLNVFSYTWCGHSQGAKLSIEPLFLLANQNVVSASL